MERITTDLLRSGTATDDGKLDSQLDERNPRQRNRRPIYTLMQAAASQFRGQLWDDTPHVNEISDAMDEHQWCFTLPQNYPAE